MTEGTKQVPRQGDPTSEVTPCVLEDSLAAVDEPVPAVSADVPAALVALVASVTSAVSTSVVLLTVAAAPPVEPTAPGGAATSGPQPEAAHTNAAITPALLETTAIILPHAMQDHVIALGLAHVAVLPRSPAAARNRAYKWDGLQELGRFGSDGSRVGRLEHGTFYAVAHRI